MQTLSKEKHQFIIVYCTATTPPTNISLKEKLVGNWTLEKLDSRALGGDVLNEFGTFWLAYKEGSILSGRSTRDNLDLIVWLKKTYPKFRQKLLEPLYDEILKKEGNNKRWRLVGDETFHLGVLRYVWIVVPPNISLKTGPFDFHAKDDPEDKTGQRKRLLKELIKNANRSVPKEKRVQIHVFNGGRIKTDELDYTLNKLPHTMPLMMEAIRYSAGSGSEEELELQILPENYGSVNSTAGKPIGSLMTNYGRMTKVESKPKFSKKNVGNQSFLDKGGHPYLAYPDAVGFVLHPKQTGAELRSDLEEIIIDWDFEQAEKLKNGLLNPENLNNAIKFYDKLSDMDASWIKNPTLDSIIRKYSIVLINNLTVQDFIVREKHPRKKPNYQYTSNRMIEDKGGIQSWIDETDDGAYQKLFELNMSGLAYANRRSDGERIQTHIKQNIRILKVEDSEIQQDRKAKFQHLAEAASHRLFDFNMTEFGRLDDIADRAFGPNTNQDKRHYLGLRLLKEAYRDGPDVRPKILEYQKKLLDKFPGPRDPDYYLEMLVDLSRGIEDPEVLDEALEFYEDNSKKVTNWGMATRIKLGVELSRKNRDIPQGITGLIDDIIPEEIDTTEDVGMNPIVRCLSWGARLCDIHGMTEMRDKFFNALRSRAEDAIEGRMDPFKDALGLTHACHLLDLEARGWGKIITGGKIGNEYLDLVLKNSLKTTRDWYEKNYHKDDPLKPLNLMHR